MLSTLYDYWFVQFDFPDENGRPYRSSGGTMVYNEQLKREIPLTFEVVPLSAIMTLLSGYSFSSDLYTDEGRYKLLTIKNIQDSGIIPDVDNYIDNIPNNMPNYCNLKPMDILISLTGNVGRVGLMYEKNYLLNQRVALVDIKNESLRPYAYCLLKSTAIRKKLELISGGSSQANLSPIEATNILIAYQPSIAYQFACQVEQALYITISNLKQNRQLAQLRNWLLPMLMNGQATVTQPKGDNNVNYRLSDC